VGARASVTLRRLAGYPWRWCLRRADAQFKTDAEGQHVYFPYGIHSAGRIAPNEAEYVRLRNAIAWLLVAMPVVVPLLFLWFSLVPIWVYVLTAGPAAAAFWILVGRRTWMRWPASAERLTLRDVDERSPWMYRSAWFLLVLSVVLMVPALFMAALSGGGEPLVVGLAGAAFFGALALFAWWQIRAVRRVSTRGRFLRCSTRAKMRRS